MEKSTFFEMTTKSHPDLPQYSSVMDNMDLEYPILPVPGKLDIATLRFLYFDKVEKTDGELLHVPSGANSDPNNPQKTILETAGAQKANLKNYKICGWDPNHPLFCNDEKDSDYGVSPLEVVTNLICKTHNSMLSKRNRYDGENIEDDRNLFAHVNSHYKKWEEYRDNILASQGKSILDYSFLNPDYIKKYNEIMKEAAKSPDIKPYYMVRRPIFDYFKRAAFAPAKHCIYKESSEGEGKFRYKAVALENIEEKILNHYPENSEKEREVFINCSSPVVKTWAKETKKEELVAEVGFFDKKKRYFIRPNEKTDSVDEESAFESSLG